MPTARSSTNRLLLVLATWLLGVGVATAVGLGALQMIGDRVTDRATRPLSERAVDNAAAAADTAGPVDGQASVPRAGGLTTAPKTTTPKTTSKAPRRPSDDSSSGSPASPPPQQGQVRSFPTRGGVVVASCVNDKIVLLYAVPEDGYRSDVPERGPERVEAEFEGGEHHSRVAIRCVSGVPTRIEEDSGDDWGSTDR